MSPWPLLATPRASRTHRLTAWVLALLPVLAASAPAPAQVGHESWNLQTLLSERQAAGRHTLLVDVSRLPAGAYYIHLDAGVWTDQARLAVAR